MTAPHAGPPEADRAYQQEPIAGLTGASVGGGFEAERFRGHDSRGTLHDLSASSPWPSWSRGDPGVTRLYGQSPVAYRAAPERPADGAELRAAVAFGKDQAQAQRVFERCQAELLLQSRRQDEVFNSIAKVETDLSRVARLAAENEGLHAAERQQRQTTLAGLSRRTEDALLTCESLRKGQERVVAKVEHLEALAEDGCRAVEEARKLQREVTALQDAVREKLDVYGHALRRLDAMEQVQEENARLRQEVAQLRRASERRDLEMAAVQGQLDALTKLVKEQLREPPQFHEPPSPPPRSEWTPSPD